jgi:branched-subunit amino acid transport protein
VDQIWLTVIVGSAAVFSWKILGYVLPAHVSKNETVVRIANNLTVALLAALFVVQAVSGKGGVVLDSRIPAVLVAAVLYWRKAPYLVAVVAAAVVAAVLRQAFQWS